ncbi:hypothetical protein ACHQM5_023963 [Ranunculus cassubicifolius]
MAAQVPLYLLILVITISGQIFNFVQSDNYIVHMDLLAIPKVFSDPKSWYAATLSSISHQTPNSDTIPKLIHTYNSVIHGFCASLSPSQIELLKKSPGFVYSITDGLVYAQSTRTPEFLGLDSKFGAWGGSSYGKDIIIGVIDSGVWPESESFRDQGMTEVPARWKGKCVSDIAFNSSMCNKKLIGARFYNQGIISGAPDELNIVLNSTRDTDGHGTHTASTAAGNFVKGASYYGYASGTAKGVAPHARLAIYKAIWDGHGFASDYIAAIDQAIDDGVDVLSISVSWVELSEDPIAIACFAAMQKGIFVAAAARNFRSFFTVRNSAPWVLTVGESSIDRSFRGAITLGNGVSISGESLYVGNSSVNKLPLVYVEDCSDIDLKENKNIIVVCVVSVTEIFDYSLSGMMEMVESAGVAGGIFLYKTNNIENNVKSSFPASLVRYEDGQTILDYINKSSNPSVSLEFYKTQIGTKPAPVVSKFSSRGPSVDYPGILKPDLIAPGTLVLASWSPSIPFNIMSGTSVACAHAAGVAALLKTKHPEWSAAVIRSAMMTTADTLDNTLKPIDVAVGMGAGHINPNKALNPGLVYDAKVQDYVRFLCSTNYTKNQIKMITKSSSVDCSNPAPDINYPSFIAFFNATTSSKHKVVHVFRRTLTNIGDEMTTYTSRLSKMNELEVSVEPTTLVFKRKYDTQNFTLTIKGLATRYMYEDGSITWIDTMGKYAVRSPITATSLTPEDIDDEE